MDRNSFGRALFGAAASLCVLAALLLPDRGIASEVDETRNLDAAAPPLIANSSASTPRAHRAATTPVDHIAAPVGSASMFRSFAATVESDAVSQIAEMPAHGDSGDGPLAASGTSFATVVSVAPAAATAVSGLRAGGRPAQSLNAARVPEPETYAMILAGLGLMGFVARRRRRQQE